LVYETQWYPGKHEPMVTLAQFEKAQALLGRPGRARPKRHEFAYTGLEIREVYQSFDGTSPQVIPRTKTAFLTEARNFDIVHIAAHAELDLESPLFSRILLGKDEWSDGVLELREILETDLSKTELVVLSACHGQWAPDNSGDEIITLNRAFLFAGAAAVVASPSPVDDKVARVFMNTFYSYLKDRSKGDALRMAQLKVREKYPLPSAWAAFVLTGDPGMLGRVATTRGPLRMRISGFARGTQGPYLSVETQDGSCIRVRLTRDTRIIKTDGQIGTADPVSPSDKVSFEGPLSLYATFDQDTTFYATEIEVPVKPATYDAEPDACANSLQTPNLPAEVRVGMIRDEFKEDDSQVREFDKL
jgi:hypothetical protein